MFYFNLPCFFFFFARLYIDEDYIYISKLTLTLLHAAHHVFPPTQADILYAEHAAMSCCWHQNSLLHYLPALLAYKTRV